MTLFRKKPLMIEAWQFNGEDRCDWPGWVKGHPATAFQCDDRGNTYTISIDTLEGRMIANKGDWIVQGITGELYPCKPHIFEQSYEAVG